MNIIYHHGRKLFLAALISIAFSIINNNVQAQTGSIQILNKGKGITSDSDCSMYVYVKKIKLEPGITYRYITWPENWDLAATLETGQSIKLYISENERMMVRTSSGNVSEYFWSYQVLLPGQSPSYQLYCK